MDLHLFIPHIWLAIAVLGLALASLSLLESVADFLTTRPTNGFRALAVGDIATESLRVVLYLSFAGIGIYYTVAGLEVARTGIAWIMVGAETIIVVKTLIQIIVRRYLRVTHARISGEPETQDQREDREFGDKRRALEVVHNEEDT